MKAWIFKAISHGSNVDIIYNERDIRVILGKEFNIAALCEIKKYLEKSRGLEFKIIEIEETVI